MPKKTKKAADVQKVISNQNIQTQVPPSSYWNLIVSLLQIPGRHPWAVICTSALLLGGGAVWMGMMGRNKNPSPCEGFSLVEGDFTSNTKLAVIGEIHNNMLPKEARKNLACIEKITKNVGPHVVLLEGVPSGVKVNCQDFDLAEKPERECIGSEDLEEAEKTESALEQHIYDEFFRYFKSQYRSENQFDAMVQNALKDKKEQKPLKQPKSLSEKYSNAHKQRVTEFLGEKLFRDLAAHKNSGKTYRDFFETRKVSTFYQDYYSKPVDPNDPEITKKTLKNNQALVALLATRVGMFTVVRGGKYHFVDPGGEIGAGARYFQAELRKGKDQNPYAILAVDDDEAAAGRKTSKK